MKESRCIEVLPRGRNFGRKPQKGAAKKCEGPEILAAEFLIDLQKRAVSRGGTFSRLLVQR
jgi:hypothetical protein